MFAISLQHMKSSKPNIRVGEAFLLIHVRRLMPFHADHTSIRALADGHHVSRISDFIIYSVEAEYIDRVVQEFGPCEYFSRYTHNWQSLTARFS